mmetsp:Transcript_27390/g.56052  ORF Transcript_27390/g.56052 Transcript_27390/m.56052 type:complete len:99 (-) Transcript_27390:439-735(-)
MFLVSFMKEATASNFGGGVPKLCLSLKHLGLSFRLTKRGIGHPTPKKEGTFVRQIDLEGEWRLVSHAIPPWVWKTTCVDVLDGHVSFLLPLWDMLLSQ